MQKNQSIELNIESIANGGSGVGHYDGMAVFVPMTAPGDVIEAKLVKVMKTHAFGIVSRVIKPSDARVEPDCPVYRVCGGCSLRHVAYEAELEIKAGWLRDSLLRIGGLDVPIDGITPSPVTGRYRNKAQYPVRLVGGRPRTGFFAPRSHTLIPVEDCLLQPAFFADICRAVCDFLEEHSIPPYDEATHTGLLRHIYIRHAEATGQTMICLVINGGIIHILFGLSDHFALADS